MKIEINKAALLRLKNNKNRFTNEDWRNLIKTINKGMEVLDKELSDDIEHYELMTSFNIKNHWTNLNDEFYRYITELQKTIKNKHNIELTLDAIFLLIAQSGLLNL